ncbi:MAG: sialidase family protein [Actinomycetota bacterium]
MNPRNPQVVVAGANDYCAAIENGDVWTGYYRSIDGGDTWSNSLVPGYLADTSSAGLASPVHGSCAAAGDPTQAFDREGRLFYAFICFNRSGPVNGSVFAARYLDDGATYDRTVLIKKGTPSGLFLTGLFQDKINLTVDQSGGSHDGNVYVAWSQYDGFAPTNAVLFSRSTDHGLSYSRPIRVTPVALGTASFADLGVGPDGAVYLTFLTYPQAGRAGSAIWLLKSTDGGASFGRAIRVASITLFDSNQFSGNGSYECGDGPFACPTGFTYSRFFSSSAVAADASGVHVVYGAELPTGQAKIFVRNSPDGVNFPTPATTLDAVPVGHQWFPDVASAGGTITVIFYDSRRDPAYSPDRPPGNTAGGVNSGDVVQAMVARSSNGGATWSESVISTAGSNFGWETHGSRRFGFWGDYLYVSAVLGGVNVTWTDSRDLVPGADPRETGADDDHDGFDVLQPCTYVPNDINALTYSSPLISDPCLSMGGLDQNIYAARL